MERHEDQARRDARVTRAGSWIVPRRLETCTRRLGDSKPGGVVGVDLDVRARFALTSLSHLAVRVSVCQWE